jgi:hypothetical protein
VRRKRTGVAVVLAALLGHAVPVFAEPSIQLELRNGRVWLVAIDVPVRDILREWARLGGATIVNADQIESEPVTLELSDIPERLALDVILRDVPGYILAARADGSGVSVFDRILIIPKTTTPIPAPVVAAVRRQPNNNTRQANDGLPEALASLIGSRVAGGANPDSADLVEVDRETQLPEPLANIIPNIPR